MINELKILNFRGFSLLELQGLKRVNLIVGENNAGKTSLLEAVFALCEPKKIGQLPGLFRVLQGNSDSRYFHWLLKDKCEGGRGSLTARSDGGTGAIYLARPDVTGPQSELVQSGPFLNIWSERRINLSCRVISVYHRDPVSLVSLVGKAQRKGEGEETLQRLLAKIDPRIRKVRVDPGEDGNQVILDIGLSELVPVSQVGQGVYRLVAILADIIGENPGVVLIDEVENGLHHTVLEQVWSGLAETAEKLDVQIFATTHSGECLKAAHDAFAARSKYDLAVIQLFRVEGRVQGRVIDREHIEAAISGHIDLR